MRSRRLRWNYSHSHKSVDRNRSRTINSNRNGYKIQINNLLTNRIISFGHQAINSNCPQISLMVFMIINFYALVTKISIRITTILRAITKLITIIV